MTTYNGRKLEGDELRAAVKDELQSLKKDLSRGLYTEAFEVATLLGIEDELSGSSGSADDEALLEEVYGRDFCVLSPTLEHRVRIDKTRYGWDFFVDRAIKRIGKDAVLNILLELEET